MPPRKASLDSLATEELLTICEFVYESGFIKRLANFSLTNKKYRSWPVPSWRGPSSSRSPASTSTPGTWNRMSRSATNLWTGTIILPTFVDSWWWASFRLPVSSTRRQLALPAQRETVGSLESHPRKGSMTKLELMAGFKNLTTLATTA